MLLGSALAAGLMAQPGPKPLPPAANSLSALGTIQPGEWRLHPLDHLTQARSVCISEASALLQVSHGGASCSRFVIASSDHEVTVHYTCPGAGHGRTTIRVESPKLLQIDTQGIVSNAPFANAWEGRRTGDCSGKTLGSSH